MTLPTVQEFKDAKRDLDDMAEVVNSADIKDVTTRDGKSLPTMQKVMKRFSDHAVFRNRGGWIAGTDYETKDIWKAGDNVWHVVLENYTSGVSEQVDIDSKKVSVHQVNIATDTVKNIAALKLFEPSEDGQRISVLGVVIAGIGATEWFYDAGDTSTPYNIAKCIITASGKRWKRLDKVLSTTSEYGVIADNLTDDTASLELFNDDVKGEAEIPAGSYLFKGKNLSNIASMKVSPKAAIRNQHNDRIVMQDAGISWLQHNHLEEKVDKDAPAVITSGNVPPPPLFSGQKQSHTNVKFFWYQDFGLQAVLANPEKYGDSMWYDWSWLRHGATGDGYESKRHPWLGFYRGDDVNVLDWQCFWLNEAGVTGVIPQLRGDGAQFSSFRDTWSLPTDINHWMYQLFNHTPNFKQLTYTLWAWSGSATPNAETRALIEGSFDEIIKTYDLYDNVDVISKNGKTYPVVFAFEAGQWRGAYDNFNGDANTRVFLIAQAAKFKAAGFSGFCLLARHGVDTLVGDLELEQAGVIYLESYYSSTNYTPSLNGGKEVSTTYKDLADGVGIKKHGSNYPAKYVVPNVCTARESHSAHPAPWNWQGSTPALFGRMVRNVLRRGRQAGSPPMFTGYNVSEWGEGGPSLQPNMRDGKGYLDELRAALNSVSKDIGFTPPLKRQSPNFLSAPTVRVYVDDNAETIPIKVSFAWASTATPFFDDSLAFGGKRLRLTMDSGSLHSGPITLKDETILPGSGLKLSAPEISLSKNDSVQFEYDPVLKLYVQISAVINII